MRPIPRASFSPRKHSLLPSKYSTATVTPGWDTETPGWDTDTPGWDTDTHGLGTAVLHGTRQGTYEKSAAGSMLPTEVQPRMIARKIATTYTNFMYTIHFGHEYTTYSSRTTLSHSETTLSLTVRIQAHAFLIGNDE